LEWGKYSTKLQAIGVEKKQPKLYDDLIDVWEAFLVLNSSRIKDESIKFSEIESWLNLSNVHETDRRQEMAYLIRVLDSEYLQFVRKSNK